MIPIFQTDSPDTLARSVTFLKSRDISHRIAVRNEGSIKIPYRVDSIVVSGEDADRARGLIQSLAGQVITSHKIPVITKSDRIVAWVQLVGLAIIILIAIVSSLRSN